MERFTISKSEKQTIYEIYRACRLCGAGGGYRMPIIQNIVDLESSDVELRQKIQECLQLEVRHDDRMPPLICELCVDKVNDFYEFFNLTRQTNVRTRTRLGLPLHTAKKGETEQSDCILGVTEPVYVKGDETAKKSRAGPKCSKIKKEPDAVKVKTEVVSDSSRSSSVSSRTSRAHVPSPPALRAKGKPDTKLAQPPPKEKDKKAPKEKDNKAPKEKDNKAPKEKDNKAPKEKDKKAPKERKSEVQYLLEDNIKFDEVLTPRATKRSREEPPKPAPPPKRTNPPRNVISGNGRTTRSLPKEPEKEPSPPPRSRPGPKSKKPEYRTPETKDKKAEDKTPSLKQDKSRSKAKPESKPKETPKPREEETPKTVKCVVCEAQLKTVQAYGNHIKSHSPTFTKLTHACNPCEKWFATAEEATTHHRYHRAVTFPYHCRHCFEDYTTLQLYNDHISDGSCQPPEPDPPTPPRPREGGKCPLCKRTYATTKSLKKHECRAKKKRDLIADPDILRRLKPMQVRIRRCDDLFAREVAGYYDVSAVKPNYGLAKHYVYPYLKFSPVKTEPLNPDSMVAIPVTLKEEFATEYTNWDSDDSDSDFRVPSLSTLAIKKLFSKNCLGKVPKRRKRVKNEAFEDNDFGDIENINDLISSLEDKGNSNLGSNEMDRIRDIIGCLDSDMDGGENADGNDRCEKSVTDDSNLGSNEIDRVMDVIGCLDKDMDGGENLDGNDKCQENVDEDSKDENVNDRCEKSVNDYSHLGSNEIDRVTDVIGCLDKDMDGIENLDGNDKCQGNVDEDSKDENVNDRCEKSVNDDSNLGSNEMDRVTDVIGCLDKDMDGGENLDGNDKCQENVDEDSKDETVNEGSKDENATVCNGDVNTDDGFNECTKDLIQDNERTDSEINSIEIQKNNAESNDNLVANNDWNHEEKEDLIRLQNEDSNNINEINDLKRSQSETLVAKENLSIDDDSKKVDISLHTIENQMGIVTESEDHENVSVNGNDESKSNHDEEISKQVNKESPIKHSIENLIGDADKKTDKYISEVISSIEDIINKNPRNEDRNQNGDTEMNVMDEFENKEKISDNDKITLEDLLPKEDRHMELDNISDDDFDFDA